MLARRLITVAVALGALLSTGPVAHAQEAARVRAAAAYGAADWPASATPRQGIDPATLKAEGWRPVRLERDPRRGAATAWFGVAASPTPDRPLALVSFRLWETPKAARAALLAELAATQARLERLPGCGDLAFAAAPPKPTLVYGTFGDVAFTVRGLKPGLDVSALAVAVDGALRASAPREPGAPSAAPRVLAVEVGAVAPAGAPTPLRIVFDPSAPRPAAVVVVCEGGASVLEVAGGYELYPAGPGAVSVAVFACGADLAGSRHAFEVVVPAE